jgi:hypothetical protein
MTRDGSGPEMDRRMIRIAPGYGWMTEVDDRRWMTGDGPKEMDHGRRMAINPLPLSEDIAVMRSYTIVEITYFDFKLRSCNGAQICRHTMYRRHCSTEYDTEHYSEISNYAATCPSSNAEYDPESDPESHSYNADTAHHEALRD